MKTYYRMKPGVLSRLLAENDITQTDFAELVDIPQAMMSFYGRGKLNVPEERIKKIAEQFGERIEDIADAVERRRERAPRVSALVLLPGLRRCRLNAGLSQKELAAKAGLCRGSIVAWEANNRRAEVIKAHRLCEALGVQLSDITRADEKSAEPHTVAANMSLSELASALVNAAATAKAENERLKATQEKQEGKKMKAIRTYYFTYEGDRYGLHEGKPRPQPYKGGWTEIEAISERAARSLYNAVHPEVYDRERFGGYDFVLTKDEMRALRNLDNGVNGYKCVERITYNVEVRERGAMNA